MRYVNLLRLFSKILIWIKQQQGLEIHRFKKNIMINDLIELFLTTFYHLRFLYVQEFWLILMKSVKSGFQNKYNINIAVKNQRHLKDKS